MIGGAAAGVVKYALKHDIESVEYIELNREMIEFVKGYFPNMQSLNDDRVALHYKDPVTWVNLIAAEHRYDVVLLSAPNPVSGRLNRYYTVEFFRAVKGVLANRGVLCLSLTGGENYITREGQLLVGSVYLALKETFGKIYIYHINDKLILVVSDNMRMKRLTPMRVKDELLARDVGSNYLADGNVDYLYQPFRQEQAEELMLDSAGEIFPNTNYKPIAYFLGLVRWSRLGGFGEFLKPFFKLKLWMWLLLCGIFALIVKVMSYVIFKGRLDKLLLIPVIGFQGLLIEMLLLYYFQALMGYLYWAIGILTSIFMVGLFLGSSVYKRWFKFEFRTYLVCDTAFLLLLLLSLNSLDMNFNKVIIIISFVVLQVISGFVVGLLFPISTDWMRRENVLSTNIGGVYFGLELLGSSVAAISAGFILIPTLGIMEVLYGWILLVVILLF